MTREEIQKVIDKGGYLVSQNDELHIGSRIIGDRVYFEYSIMLHSGIDFSKDSYNIGAFPWREATEDEIKKYLK